MKHIKWLFFTTYSYHSNFSAKSYQVESFWQIFFTVLLDFVISRKVQKKTPKRYRWNLQFTSDIRAELSNPQVLLSDIVIIYPLLLIHKQFSDAPDLEDTELGIWKQFSKQNGEFFQILHDKNHWLVVARVVECADVEV